MTIEQTIEIPASHRVFLDLPVELPIGKAKVKLTVIPEKSRIVPEGQTAFGCLNRFAAPEKISGEKNTWTQAVLEKHAKN